MEQNLIRNRYGVSHFLSKVYVNRIDEYANKDEYMYIVEIIQGDDYNGNGYCTMKIYTKGAFKEIAIGKWRISPIVQMPYYWGGYSDKIDVVDYNNNLYTIEIQPDNTSLFKKGGDYTLDVKGVFEKIFSLENVLNVTHLQLEEVMNKIKDVVNATYSSYPFHVDAYFEEAKILCLQLKEKEHLQKLAEQYELSIMEMKNNLLKKYLKE